MSDSENPTSHQALLRAIQTLGPKPADDASQQDKKGYSEQASKVIALTIAAQLRERGLEETRPTEPGMSRGSGAERRIAGGIGAKKVDITWATEEAGLLLAFSIKTINFRDKKSNNYQKNVTNRRGDLLFECITLHRRFPFSVLTGLFFFDAEAKSDQTSARASTFENTLHRLALFDGRSDPHGRDEQFEHLYVATLKVEADSSAIEFYRVTQPEEPVTLDAVIETTLKTIAVRNPDFYTYGQGRLNKA